MVQFSLVGELYSTGVLPDDGRGVFLGGGAGLLLAGGTGVVLGCGTGVFLGGGFPLGVVDPGPPVDASREFGVLAPRPGPGRGVLPEGLEIALNMSTFLKSSLKYARLAFSLSIMSGNEDLHNSTVVGMYLGLLSTGYPRWIQCLASLASSSSRCRMSCRQLLKSLSQFIMKFGSSSGVRLRSWVQRW